MNCGTITFDNNSIYHAVSKDADINFASTQQDGNLNIGTNNSRPSTSSINIGTGTSSVGVINIGNSTNATPAAGATINIGKTTTNPITIEPMLQ